MNRYKTGFLAMACLAITTSLYAAQPILPDLAITFHEDPAWLGTLMGAAFLGNAIAQVLVVPLADCRERRSLAQLFITLCIVGDVVVACSPTAPVALAGSLLVGVGCCSNMLILSYAAGLAKKSEKGTVVATIMGGVLAGIVLSRMISGFLTELFSWRAMYVCYASCLIVVVMLLFRFPKSTSTLRLALSYKKLLTSMVLMVREHKALRAYMLRGMSGFFVFNMLWTGLTFLLSAPPFRFDSFKIGLFGLAGIAGIIASRKAGSLFDKGRGKQIILCAWIVLATSWIVLVGGVVLTPLGTGWAVLALATGIVMLDAAMQSQHIINQSFILSMKVSTQGRALTAYMGCNLLVGSGANLMISFTYGSLGWIGICILCFALCALLIYRTLCVYRIQ